MTTLLFTKGSRFLWFRLGNHLFYRKPFQGDEYMELGYAWSEAVGRIAPPRLEWEVS